MSCHHFFFLFLFSSFLSPSTLQADGRENIRSHVPPKHLTREIRKWPAAGSRGSVSFSRSQSPFFLFLVEHVDMNSEF